jgi:excisionase family DNA binding protein
VIEPRLLSTADAARYLGLGSRWAMRRLIAAGEIPVIKVLGKLRTDRRDLDVWIEEHKGDPVGTRQLPPVRRGSLDVVRRQLAPLPRARVTATVTAASRRSATP